MHQGDFSIGDLRKEPALALRDASRGAAEHRFHFRATLQGGIFKGADEGDGYRSRRTMNPSRFS